MNVRVKDKDWVAAFELVDKHLRHTPDDYRGLYQIGYVASLSGERRDEAMLALEKCLTMTPPEGAPGLEWVHLGLVCLASCAPVLLPLFLAALVGER